MHELRFDGRVVVITGAGRGIGRAYARLLAERGASVVVNDFGVSIGGEGTDIAPAAAVATEIAEAGGQAIADQHDVSTAAGADALVAAAIERFRRVDIVINNAGIIRWAGIADADAANLDAHVAVHVGGSFHTARAAWPHFAEQGYGRIVMTTSTGILGLPRNLGYATAKGGVIGLTRNLAMAGRKHGIKANLIAPAAFTRMSGDGPAELEAQMPPELVAPMAAYLAHDDCPVSGEIYTAGAGRFARLFIASTIGVVDEDPTIESVAANWAAINDEEGYYVPADLPSWSASFLEHLRP